MPNPLKNPHQIFFLAIPTTIIIGLFNRDNIISINIKDTYYVISNAHITYLIAIVFGVIGIGYWTIKKANRKLSKQLTRIHLVLTFGGLLALLIIHYIPQITTSNTQFTLFDDEPTNNLTRTIIALLIAFAQLVFLVNIITSLFRKTEKSKPNPSA